MEATVSSLYSEFKTLFVISVCTNLWSQTHLYVSSGV